MPINAFLDGLWPESRCWYRTRYRRPGTTEYLAGPERSFWTQRRRGAPFTFAVEADPHMVPGEGDTAQMFELTLQNIADASPDFLIDLGDNFMLDKWDTLSDDTIRHRMHEYRRWWGEACHSVPLFLVLGNHEGEQGWDYDSTPGCRPVRLTNARKRYFPNPVPDGFYSGDSIPWPQVGLREDYYAWEWGNALFVTLDPFWYTTTKPSSGEDNWNWTLGRPQYDWLKRTLEQSDAKFKFVFIHHLVGGQIEATARGGIEYCYFYEQGGYRTDSTWGFDAERPGWGEPLHQLMLRTGVDIFWYGHTHFWAKQDTDNMVYQMVPQPGRRQLDTVPNQAEPNGYVSGKFLASSGYARVTVGDDTVLVEYVRSWLPGDTSEARVNGEVAHSYVIVKSDPLPGGWQEVAPMPEAPSGLPVKRGGWLADDPASGLIYGAKGYKTPDFYRYDPRANSWSPLAPIPDGPEGQLPEKGCRGVCDGNGRVYMTKGNRTLEFWCYDVASDSWFERADVPAGPRNKDVKGGTDLVWVDPWLYLLKGYYSEFYRYDPSADNWQALPDAPEGIKPKWNRGSWLAYDGRYTIYAHKANYYDRLLLAHEMHAFDLRGDTWHAGAPAGMPLDGLHSGRIRKKKAKDGSAGVWYSGNLYALKGGNTQQFWRYSPEEDAWTELDTVPTLGSAGRKRRVKYGGDLVQSGDALWALKGNKTLELWRYGFGTAGLLDPAAGLGGGEAAGAVWSLSLAPNPAPGLALLHYNVPAAVLDATLYDASGRRLQTIASGRPIAGSGALPLCHARLPSGVYFVRVEAGPARANLKLVVE